MTVMVVCAHPDDAEITMGGTIAKYSNRRQAVIVVSLTTGELGQGRIHDPGMSETRIREAHKAARVLGCRYICLPYKDGRLTVGDEPIYAVAQLIRKYKPSVLFSHFVFDAHPDHRVAGVVASDARHRARLRDNCLKGKPHNVAERFTFSPVLREMQGLSLFHPDVFIDITSVYSKKVAALKQHASQVKANPAYLDIVEARARYIGSQIGTKFAEGFMAEVKRSSDLPLPRKGS